MSRAGRQPSAPSARGGGGGGCRRPRAAAVVMSTLLGARLYHDGQLEGRRTHIPVFLGRGPDELADGELRAFYERLIGAVGDSGLHEADWQLCECSGWPDNASHERLVSWCWADARSRHLVVTNFSDEPAQARVRLPWGDDLRGRTWRLADRPNGETFRRDGEELADAGLYVGLEPWASYL